MTDILTDLEEKAKATPKGEWHFPYGDTGGLYAGENHNEIIKAIEGTVYSEYTVDSAYVEMADGVHEYLIAANPQIVLAMIAQMRQMRLALDFYANPENYKSQIKQTKPFMLNGKERTDSYYEDPEIQQDNGDHACQALASFDAFLGGGK